MTQLSIDFDAPAPVYRPEHAARRTDAATSHAAAARACALAADHHSRILSALRDHGAAGKSAIADRIGLDGHQVGKRMAEMQRAGLIALTGKTVLSASGRSEREWEVA